MEMLIDLRQFKNICSACPHCKSRSGLHFAFCLQLTYQSNAKPIPMDAPVIERAWDPRWMKANCPKCNIILELMTISAPFNAETYGSLLKGFRRRWGVWKERGQWMDYYKVHYIVCSYRDTFFAGCEDGGWMDISQPSMRSYGSDGMRCREEIDSPPVQEFQTRQEAWDWVRLQPEYAGDPQVHDQLNQKEHCWACAWGRMSKLRQRKNVLAKRKAQFLESFEKYGFFADCFSDELNCITPPIGTPSYNGYATWGKGKNAKCGRTLSKGLPDGAFLAVEMMELRKGARTISTNGKVFELRRGYFMNKMWSKVRSEWHRRKRSGSSI